MSSDKPATRHVGVLQLSSQLLFEVLHLPPDTLILNAQVSMDRLDVIQFLIMHPDLPEVAEGNVVPPVSAQFESKLRPDLTATECVFTKWVTYP